MDVSQSGFSDKKSGIILDWLNKYPCNYESGELQNMIDELNTASAPFGEETQDAPNQVIGSRTSSFSSSGSIRKERKSLIKMFEIVSDITIDTHPNNIRRTKDLESKEFQLTVDRPHIPVALKKSISRLSSMFSDLDMSLKVEQLSEEDKSYFLKGLT